MGSLIFRARVPAMGFAHLGLPRLISRPRPSGYFAGAASATGVRANNAATWSASAKRPLE